MHNNVKMEFRTLAHSSKESIVEVFNQAFSDYAVPVKSSVEKLNYQINVEKVDLSFSIGAFDGNALVGFILHAIDQRPKGLMAYNAGTGVIPSQRGKGLTKEMYANILPTLKKRNFKSINLEVISDNTPALKSYQAAGFVTQRILNCYKGEIKENLPHKELTIGLSKQLDHNFLLENKTYSLTWQNYMPLKYAPKDFLSSIQAVIDSSPVGQLVFNTKTKRIHHIWISKAYRSKKIATALLHYFSENISKEIVMINIDDSNKELNSFLSNLGLPIFLQQNDMELILDKKRG